MAQQMTRQMAQLSEKFANLRQPIRFLAVLEGLLVPHVLEEFRIRSHLLKPLKALVIFSSSKCVSRPFALPDMLEKFRPRSRLMIHPFKTI